MRCPFCTHDETRVVDKRDNLGLTKRRRECLKCEKRFNTIEQVENLDIRVVKKNGIREQYDSEKIRRGILKACEKRPITQNQINKMMTNIQEKIRKMGNDVKTSSIGEVVSKELKKTDKVAYIRYASVYREFADVADFKNEIKELLKK
jgi:transcriptional repressor NrdR